MQSRSGRQVPSNLAVCLCQESSVKFLHEPKTVATPRAVKWRYCSIILSRAAMTVVTAAMTIEPKLPRLADDHLDEFRALSPPQPPHSVNSR